MRERIRIAGCVVLFAVALSVPAAAKPQTVTIGEAVPFSSTELADAVALRAADASLTIRVTREGDALRVDVGGASQVVVVDLADPGAAVRVVAMVVVALGMEPPALAPPGMDVVAPAVVVPAPAPTPAPTPTLSRFAVRGMIGLWRRDDTESVTPFIAAVAYRVAPTWRLAASVTSQNRITHEPDRWTILRFGLETFRFFEPLGIEGGLLVVPDSFGVVPGAYVDARYYQRFGSHFRLVAGVGAHWIKVDCVGSCTFANESTSAYLHGGLEWRL